MPTNFEYTNLQFGNREPNFQGEHGAQGVFSDEYSRVDTANANDPTSNIPATTWRGAEYQPPNLLDEQARQVQEAVDSHLEMNAAYGLRQPIAGHGVHTDKRDERGYGNVPPDGESGVPFKKK